MKLKSAGSVSLAIVLAVAWVSPIGAQDARVDIGKHSRKIPRSCELLRPANIDGMLDVPALVKEAICKGAGDMLGEYTYTVNSLKREKDKKGKVKDETFVYEVFIPTLKSGTHTRGVLVVTSHNGVAVPPEELQKERLRAAEKIEKEEERIERNAPATTEPDSATGMLPLGMYSRTTISRSSFGMKQGGVTLAVVDFLRSSDLSFVRREQFAGRDTLVFSFIPRAGTKFGDNQKYIAQLSGEIWIDAQDRIATRLIGWPANVANPWPTNPASPWLTNAAKAKSGVNQDGEMNQANDAAVPFAGERLPAVYLEMMRLPNQGVWLPHVIHMNGADHQTLFDGIKTISTSIYSNYVRFSTEVKDAEVGPPIKP